MNYRHTVILVAGFAANLGMVANASAQTTLDAAQKRYDEDRKICADESNSSMRMQCLRDSKAEYDKAVAAANAKSAVPAAATVKTATSAAAAPCTSCGKVTAIRVVEKQGEGSATGMVVGGLAGALLGNQIGKGGTRDVATIAGAAGGAYAGKKIEENMNSGRRWDVSVRFDNGDERMFSFDKDPGFSVGSPILGSGNTIVAR
jgi:outer membrane lipoprotein SlyB